MPNKEKEDVKRRYTVTDIGIKTRAGKENILFGDAAVFNSRSGNVGGYFEILHQGFFRTAIKPENLEAFALFNHERSLVLGATRNGELTVKETLTSLYQETELKGDTQISRDMIAHAAAKRIYRQSFSFTNYREAEVWRNEGNTVICELVADGCSRLFDVSPVTFAAYTSTSLGLRDMPEFSDGNDFDSEMTALVRAEKNLPFTRSDLEALKNLSNKINMLLAKSISDSDATTEGDEAQKARTATIEALKGRIKGISA